MSFLILSLLAEPRQKRTRKTIMARRRRKTTKRRTTTKKAKTLSVAKKKQVRKAITGLKKLLK